jgi:hypothetical protein
MKKGAVTDRNSRVKRKPGKTIGRSEEGRPSRPRIFRVAAGLATWTAAERRWLAKHPEDLAWHNRLQEAFRNRETGGC